VWELIRRCGPFPHQTDVRASPCRSRKGTFRRIDLMKRFMTAAALLGTLTVVPQVSFAQAAPDKDIVQTAVAAGSFNTLARALTAAGLVETLKGKGPFTVFAPTDAAFAKIPAAQLNALLADKAKLTAVLTYHVVSGAVMASQVVGLKDATTVQGGKVGIAVVDGKVKLNGNSTVTATDIRATNGVIHVIDTVLMPPAAHGGMNH
jgi:uncharacterized surface protein with fasciclin (FAS1) repeats